MIERLSFLRELTPRGLGAPFLVLLMLAMMVLPIPAMGLDFLFTFNIALSLIVLLVTIYATRPLEFSAFPTVLLVATMLRLSLNIASTRVVLLEGHTGTAAAGQVIQSFGDFVIGGNYAVGFVVFAILVVINFVVVTKGAGRVSEVSARFMLDAMPGKQMAIDADLNAGILDQEEAGKRRAEIAQEADFYGSMDGASKFVKGDAIAGILVLFINLIGGFAIGMGQHGLSASEAARNYSLLTIGDGLVAQIPSLLLSMGTAIIVTRVSSAGDMGDQITHQLFDDPRALAITGALIGLLGLVPGMPNVVFLTLGGILGGFAWHRHRQGDTAAPVPAKDETPSSERELGWDDVRPTDLLGLEVGFGLIPLVDKARGGKLPDRIRAVRRKLTEELGFLVPAVHIRDNLDLAPTRYRIMLLGVVEGEADIYPDRELAIGTRSRCRQPAGHRHARPPPTAWRRSGSNRPSPSVRVRAATPWSMRAPSSPPTSPSSSPNRPAACSATRKCSNCSTPSDATRRAWSRIWCPRHSRCPWSSRCCRTSSTKACRSATRAPSPRPWRQPRPTTPTRRR